MAEGPDAWAAGWAAVRAGQPDEAERLCRSVLRAAPECAEGWFLFGVACHTQGRNADAADGYAHALELRPDYPEALINLGAALRSLGRPKEAEGCCRRALRLRPSSPETWANLGNTLRELGRPAEAVECYTQALRLRPEFADVHIVLGHVLQDLDRSDDAAECYLCALRLRPDSAETHVSLGDLRRNQGRLDEAVDCYQLALGLRSDYPEALINLGITLLDQSRLSEAESRFRQALSLRPDWPEVHNNLGSALRDQRRPGQAANCFREALRLRPNYPEAHLNLGSTLQDQGRLDEAEACFRKVLELWPDLPEAHYILGNVLRDLGRFGDAEGAYHQALRLRPGYVSAENNLGNLLRNMGRPDEASECFSRAMQQRPEYVDAHDGLLMTLHYQAGVTPQGLAVAHAGYQARHAETLRTTWQLHDNNRDPERPLRLGLVSADFGHHPVGVLSVLAAESIARRPGTLVCYSNRRTPSDAVTLRFRSAAAVWRDTADLSDEKIADLIRADGIDVLIDLAGHTAGNRLLTFARRPAPVQVTWLGYEGTTGLEAMDYLVADERLVPPGAEAHYREQVLRLPGGYACYDPPVGAPEPGPPPALRNGSVTFGCFNNPAKLSPPALATFADVLRRVPESRLILKYRGLDDPITARRLFERVEAAGIAPGQVELRGLSGHAEYLAAYQEVDVALDPFPFNGGVTTCDALWMGVPVVTVPGDTFASRHGLSYLSAVGLAELAAHDAKEYVTLAAGLACDLGRMANLRACLRSRMARSPLCDGERLAAELLAALRTAWRAWAVGGPGNGR